MEENKRRLYVLVDKSLEPVYGCVQGAHCVVNFRNNYPSEWNNEYLIFLYANIKYWKRKLDFLNLNYSSFYEPDLNNKLTSIAIVNDGTLFKKLNLVK